ncbi:uncharacterized protein [Pseudorasbora parva]|uniref:uncharacterized protein n=1 Tax=Pseudorasbora parva TaxID=51549 RepID=UPI00351E250C
MPPSLARSLLSVHILKKSSVSKLLSYPYMTNSSRFVRVGEKLQVCMPYNSARCMSGWNESALITAFRHGLLSEVKQLIIVYEEALESLIQKSIRVSQRLSSCGITTPAVNPLPIHLPVAPPAPEPMQIDTHHLTANEQTSTAPLTTMTTAEPTTSIGLTTTQASTTTVVSTETTPLSTTSLPTTSETPTTETADITSETTTPALTTMPTTSKTTIASTSPTVASTTISTTSSLASTSVPTSSASTTMYFLPTTTSAVTSSESAITSLAQTTMAPTTTSTEPFTTTVVTTETTIFTSPSTSVTSESTTAHAPTPTTTTAASTTAIEPATTTSAATSSEAPTTSNNPTTELQTPTSAQSTNTFTTTTAFQITTAPLSSTTAAFTNTAPAISQTTLTTPAPPIITTVSPENITVAVTIMPISTTHVTISLTSTPTKTTEPPRSTASMTTMTALPTTTIPADISTTFPSTTATQTTTTFKETTGLFSTTVAFTSTSPALSTLALSTTSSSIPTTNTVSWANLNSETTSTTTTGIITGLTTTEFPLVIPVTLPGLEIQKPSPTISVQTSIETTSSASATNMTGNAIVTTKLVFSSMSSVPTESLVLGAINILMKSNQSQLNESLKVVNYTYEKISETSYAVVIKFSLSNISMSEVPELRNNTYKQVQDVVNYALNTLLNEPSSPTFQPKSSNFTSSSNQIDGSMAYTVQDGDIIKPVSFLNLLHSQLDLTTTTVFPESTTGSSVAPPNLISGPAVVTSVLLFNSSSPVPSEALVLSAINTLRQSRESKFNDSVKLVDVTYQKISETSYAVIIKFSLSNISMSEVPELRNNTYKQMQDVVNNALNTLLNEPSSPTFQPKSSNFTSSSNQIDGSMAYTVQDGDTIKPVSFLNLLHSQLDLTTTTVFPESTTGSSVAPPNLISGSAVVTSVLLFNSSSPVPGEALVLSAINTLRQSRESKLNDSVKLVDVTYQKISETSYAVIIKFSLSNISMSEVPELRNNTYKQVQDVVNNALNTLLNEPSSPTFQPKSSNFTSSSNQIDGSMAYTFQDGDTIKPVSFLNLLHSQLDLTTTTVFPESTTGSSVAPPNLISGSAVVTSVLLFNSSSPVPSEALVLSAINTLRQSRESKLNDSVKLVDVTYQKISETSYAVIIKFSLSNISMSEVPELRNNTYKQVQDVVNNALNTLLNEPSSPTFQPKSSNFTSSSNQIDGSMAYTFQDGDTIKPVSFLNLLHSQLDLTTTTVFPESTTGSSVAPPNLISSPAVVTSVLLFNSSSPVPSEALVLSAINTLRQSRESKLNDSVKVLNVTYQKISETSYAVIIKFSLSNISMSEVPELRNNTYKQVQDVVNNALNTLLNQTSDQTLQPKSSNFTSSSNQIDGSMAYTVQDGDVIKPVSFLNLLHSQMDLTTTTVFPESTTGSSVAPPNLISGSAVVTSTLLFNSSSPVPSEALVLSAINTLRQSRESKFNDSVKVVDVTYQKISETSYAIIITFSLSNISMSEVPELRNNTYKQMQDVVNNALNTLLNEPSSPTFQPKSSNFTSSSNQIDGSMAYTVQDGDTIKPVSFLNLLHSQLELITTTVFPESTTGSSVAPPNLISGSAVVTSVLLFNSSSPVPSEALVLSAINTLRQSRESKLNDSVKLVDVTYQKISETSYAVIIKFSLSNISMSEVPELRNNTYKQVQDVVNNALNTLLNEPSSPTFQPKSSNFTSSSNQIDGSMAYTVQDGDIIKPVSFLNLLHSQLGLTTTTVFPESTTGSSVAPPNLISGSAVVTSVLLFNSSSPVPSEALVLSAINTLRQSRESKLNDSVKVVDVTYQKISETSYAVIIKFSLSNISMSEVPELRNNTYKQVQDVVNNALNTLLNKPSSPTFQPKSSNFTSSSNQIDGSMAYTFQDGDTIKPVSFLNLLHSQLGLTTTTVFPESTTGSSVAPPNLISSPAVVTSVLLFNSSSPVPSEALVLSAINTLRQSSESKFNDSVKVLNVTYQKISETSYAVIIKFSLSNINMSEVPELRNNTYKQVQDVVNNALNTLLNQTSDQTLQPKSSNFTSSSNQIDGSMAYTVQDGDIIKPVSFLNLLHSQLELITTTVFPESTTGSSVAPPNLISGSAVVTSVLLFNSSSPVPSEALVLSAINTLRQSRESKFNDSVKVLNVTYQKISETSYAVIIKFSLSNISMSEVPELRNNTYKQVQDVVNNALNTLLNQTSDQTLQPKSSNFTSSSNQIDGSMAYTVQDGDVIKPVSFLNLLHSQMDLTTTTVFPESTTGSSVAPPNLISGSAVVTSVLLFNSSSPVPSEALVLSAINTLRQSRESKLNDSVKVLNVTYQKISETSYAVIIKFSLSNISMSEVPELRNNTYKQVQDVVNNALNTLLNEPSSPTFQPKSSNFTSSSNQIDGSMAYTFQDGDTIKPVSFLNLLHSQLGLTTTTVFPESTTGSSVAPPNLISSPAVVTSVLLFNSSSPVPSEALVLSAINTLRQSSESKFNDSVKVLNVTYQKISETSYAVIIKFSLSNINMSEVPELRNNTYKQVQDVVNNALNTLLNQTSDQTLQPKSSNFTSSSNQIDGSMAYTVQDGDVIKPVSFLNLLHSQLELITTTVFPESTTGSSVAPPNLISGSAVVTSVLLFNSSSPVPSEALVLSAINTLRQSRESKFNDSVKVLNVTYQKISETSYAVIIKFSLSNISMSEVPELRNNTYKQVQDVVNNALNTLLNQTSDQTLQPKSSNFTSSSNQIDGSMAYTVQDGDVIKPVSFLNLLHSQMDLTTTTVFPESTTGSSVAPPNLISGSAVVTSVLLFNSSSPVPSEALVLSAINTLRQSRESKLNDSVKVLNVTYQKISETSYAVIIKFSLSNISMSEVPELRNNTYKQVQDVVNNALNTLLNQTSDQTLQPKSSNFTSSSNQIDGSMAYTVQDGDTIKPVSFLNLLHSQLELITTTVFPESTTGSSVAPPNLISGSAVVTSVLLFNSSSPVPSEALVLSAINTLRQSRESKLNDSVKVLNVTYQKISETSYAVIIKFSLSNISMSEVPELRNNTYKQVQDVVNNALNTLLNQTSDQTLQPKSSNFTSSSNQIDGSMAYTVQDGDTIKPVSFLNLLHSQLELITTTVFPESTTGSSVAPPNLISGSAVVTSVLLFNSSSPVPSEALVLSAINTLRQSRESKFNDSVKVLNVTYQKISETSYAVIIKFSLSNISMSEVPELRNNTYKQVQDVVNNAELFKPD